MLRRRWVVATIAPIALASVGVAACGGDDAAPGAISIRPDRSSVPMNTTPLPTDGAPSTTDGSTTVTATIVPTAPSVVVEPVSNRIVFRSNRTVDGSFEIFSANADGSDLVQLTDAPGAAFAPEWSPDGTQIAFDASRGGEGEDIYTMNADGTGLRRLTDDPAVDRDPTWSPDGTRLAFVSERDGNRELYAMGADGEDLVRITDHPEYDDHPDWGPDGRITFASRRDDQWDIYLVEPDGTGLVNLTAEPDAQDNYPSWSHDGTWIAFQSNRETRPTTEMHDYWVIRPDGTEAHWVAPQFGGGCGVGASSAWSPDGSTMVVSSTCETATLGALELHLARLDGEGGEIALLPGTSTGVVGAGGWFSEDHDPDWSPT